MLITPEHLAGHAWIWTELFVLLVAVAALICMFGSTVLARWAHRDSTALASDFRVGASELLIAMLLGCAAVVWWHYGLGHAVRGANAQHIYSLAVSGLVLTHILAMMFAILLIIGCYRVVVRTGRQKAASAAIAVLGAVMLVVCFSVHL